MNDEIEKINKFQKINQDKKKTIKRIRDMKIKINQVIMDEIDFFIK